MSKTELLSYYQDNGLLLEKYYSDNSHQIHGQENDHMDENSILMYFTNQMDNKDNSKKKVINQYMCNIDDTHANLKYKEYNYNKCDNCNINMKMNEMIGEIFCEKCGLTKDILIMTEKNSYNDPPKEANYFAYKFYIFFNI